MRNSTQKSEAKMLAHVTHESRSWFAALKHSWRTALQIDRSQIVVFPAIRSTVGFALPLAIGVATGHIIEGISIAGGAVSLGSVGLTFTHRARIRTMLLACVGVAVSAFVGSITSHVSWLSVLTAGLWGIGAGLLVALGQPAMIVGLQSTVALIILTHFELDPAHAALQALLMLVGALFQTLLALVPSPWQQTTPERTALSTVYQKLADYATNPTNKQYEQNISSVLLNAHSTIVSSHSHGPREKIFLGLLEEAEYIRLNILILIRLRQNLAENAAMQTGGRSVLDQFLQAVADELRKVTNELRSTRSRVNATPLHQQIKQALSTLRQQEVDAQDKETIQQILAVAKVLRQHLHTAKKLAKSWKYPRQAPSVRITIPQHTHLQLHDAWTTLQANLTFRSTVFRHAVRLGITLALTTALYRIFPLPLQHGYWIPLTALLVLKPDFTTTFARGGARTVGTMLGAVLTTVLVSLLAPTKELLVLIDALVTYCAFSVLFANYAIFSAFITMVVVLLLSFVTPQPLVTAGYRAIDTIIGGVVALLIYAAWPTWERSQVLDNIANRLEALRQYFVAVLEAYTASKAYDEPTLHNYRLESRLARSNAQASVARSLQEPETHRIDPDLAHGLLGASDKLAQSVLALDGYLLDNPSHLALPQLTDFRRHADEALSLLVAAIRNEQPITALPDLREALHPLERANKSDARAEQLFVLTEAKRILQNINVIKQLIQ